MLNDSDLQKAAEEMFNSDAHDEVKRIIFLFLVFFSRLMMHLKMFTFSTCMLILSLVQSIILSFVNFTTPMFATRTPVKISAKRSFQNSLF